MIGLVVVDAVLIGAGHRLRRRGATTEPDSHAAVEVR
jgi:hypothetical protein